MWIQLETKLVDWEKRFVKIWTKKTSDYLDMDHEYVDRELILLKAEKSSVQMRLRKIEEIIAKAHVLLDDLNEDLCARLSGGHSLASVGEALMEKFGPCLKEDHGKGRKAIRKFLEKHLKIVKAASRDLFSLLEEVGAINYRLDIPESIKNNHLPFYTTEMKDLIYHMKGIWEFKE